MDKPWLAHYPKEVAPSLTYPKDHLASFLIHSAARDPHKRAVWFYGKTLTYQQLLNEAYQFAHALERLSLARGDRIAIMLPNCPQAVIAFYGALIAGLVVVETNPMYTAREVHHQLADSGAKAMVVLDSLWPNARDGIEGTAVEHVVVTRVSDYLRPVKRLLFEMKARKDGHGPVDPSGDGYHRWHDWLAAAPCDPIPLDPSANEEVALLQYTGGTTGVAKGVMLTHANLIANTLQTRHWCYRLRDGQEVFLGLLPFFHVFGMTTVLNFCIYVGGSLALIPRFQTAEVLKLIRRFHPTVFPGTPTMYIALLKHGDRQSHDLHSLEVCISGSAPLPHEVQEQFEALSGGHLIEGYGLTEASPVTHANPLWHGRSQGIGLPYPDTEAQVVDPSGQEVPVGEVGELIVRGPQVMKGYWNRPDETANTLRDGWLYTGDLARMDKEGYFEIVGRRKELIIAGGFNIYPREVEEVLYEHPAIEEAVVVGVPDSYRGETVKAFIMAKPGMRVSDHDLDTWCRTHLAAYKVPRSYEIRDSLPKSAIGKVLRYKLVEEAKSQGETTPLPSGPDTGSRSEGEGNG